MRRLSLAVVALLSVTLVACGGGGSDEPDASTGEVDAAAPDASNSECGNGVVEPGEDCEQGDTGGQECTDFGFPGGPLLCFIDCTFDTSACEPMTCGNGTIDRPEICDGLDLGAETCEGLGFRPDGTLACNASCDAFVTTGCTPIMCGDNSTDGDEACDGTDLESQTCVSLGFASGTLGCENTCQAFDTSNCVPSVCGNNVIETGEACDDGDTVDGEFCTADCQLPGGPIVEVCQTLAPLPGNETCAVTAGNDAKLITGTVLTPGHVYVGGTVAVDATGIIQCTGCGCAGDAGATEISCPTGVISPGLINTHDHITFTQNDPYTATDERYEQRHDWRNGKRGHTEINAAGGANGSNVRWGELRFLMGGATSTVGSGSAGGFLRNLDSTSNQEGLGQTAVNFETFPLDDSSGTQRTGDCNYGASMDTESVFNTIDAYEPHVSEGIDGVSRNEFLCMSSVTYDTTDPGVSHQLTGPESAFIHSTGLRASDYALMGVNGTALIWSPRSNITLYGDTAQVSTAAELGVLITLGTDWMPTGSMNMLRELRCADNFNETYLDGYFTDEQLWLMTTYNAASATATDDVIGRLAQGLVADISIFDGAAHPLHRAILDAEAQDVVLVMRGGKPLYGDATVIAAIPATGACDTIDVCGDSKELCASGDIGMTYAALQSANAGVYPTFFCGAPDNEPSCVPERTRLTAPMASVNGSSVYNGIPAVGDGDGDGIADGSDNCAAVFNPIRPLDNGVQGDQDSDGEGDPCDICPLNPDTTTCTPPDPNDSDADGVANATDNCPDTANTNQADADGDNHGDVCDLCPNAANPGNAGCPGTIYEIKQGTVPVGAPVQVSNAIVTARYASGFFLQVKEGDAGYLGADFSGVFVFAPANTVAEGDRVTLTATPQDFFGQTQMSGVTAITVLSSGEARPAPIAVAVSDVVTGGPRATQLEGVLVKVSDVTVAALDAAFNEFMVDTTPPGAGADLRVDDLLYLPAPFPAVNDYFTSITGALNYRNNNSKVEPRRASDILSGLAIASFGPAQTFITEGQSDVVTVPQPLTVTMNQAPVSNTFIAITSAEASVTVVGGGVTILAGQTSAQVHLNGVAQDTSVTLTATFGTQTPTATVRVLGAAETPTTLTLTPATANLASGGTLTLTATLDIPAPIAGAVVSLTVNPAGAGTVPPTMVIPGGQLSGTFDYVDNGSVIGAITVTATYNALTDDSTITTAASTTNHLVINEVDYDQAGTDAASYIEIFNGTGGAVSLAGHQILLVNGNGGAQYAAIDLAPAGSLPAGGYLLLRNSAVPANGALTIDVAGDWLQNGAPDGIVLVNGATVLDNLSYEGTMPGTPGTGATWTSVTLADTNDDLKSLIRTPNGIDNDAATDWAITQTKTPGTANP